MTQTTKMEYSHPEVLVDTQWVEEHLNDPNIRIVEVDYDSLTNYHLGHIPGAILLEWKKDINHPLSRDILTAESYKNIIRKLCLDDDKSTAIILYGDFNNWFAAFAFWVFKYYGYENLKLLNGGRKKWLDEDRPISKKTVAFSKGKFNLSESFKPISKIRVYVSDIKDSLVSRRRFQIRIVDVRSPQEYTDEITSPPEYPTEHAQRPGHIPGAQNITLGTGSKRGWHIQIC